MVKCKICEKELKSDTGLSYHIRHTHNLTPLQYQEAYLYIGKCAKCGSTDVQFISLGKGYKKLCPKCTEIERIKKLKLAYQNKTAEELDQIKAKRIQTTIERYGVESGFQIKEVREKIESKEARKKAVESNKRTLRENMGWKILFS